MRSALEQVGPNPLLIKDQECFEMLGDLIYFVLTQFVHEAFVENKLLYTIMQVAS